MEKTLNGVFDKLSPQQASYLVWCVKEYSEVDRSTFNRSLLPFLPVSEALFCLDSKLRLVLANDNKVGIRFIRNLMSVVSQ